MQKEQPTSATRTRGSAGSGSNNDSRLDPDGTKSKPASPRIGESPLGRLVNLLSKRLRRLIDLLERWAR